MSKIHKKTGLTCMLCDESLEKYNIIFHKTRRQTHALCLDCGISYLKPITSQSIKNIQKNIREKVDDVKCPGSIHCDSRNLCKHIIKLSKIIIPNEYEISNDIFKINYVMKNLNTYICPQTTCGYIIEVDLEYVSNNIICNSCFTTWCRNCLISPYHNDKSCIEVEAENNNSENGKLISELNKNGKLKFCPQCRIPCIKHNGCNKMICISCNINWCWICEKTNINYDHYTINGIGECKGNLWKGTDENGNDLPNN